MKLTNELDNVVLRILECKYQGHFSIGDEFDALNRIRASASQTSGEDFLFCVMVSHFLYDCLHDQFISNPSEERFDARVASYHLPLSQNLRDHALRLARESYARFVNER